MVIKLDGSILLHKFFFHLIHTSIKSDFIFFSQQHSKMTARLVPFPSGEYKNINGSLVWAASVNLCEYKLDVTSTDRIFSCYSDIAEFLRENPEIAKFPIFQRSEDVCEFPSILLTSKNQSYVEFIHLNESEHVCVHILYEIEYTGKKMEWKK